MRSVVLRSSERCRCCQLPLRWCVGEARREIECSLAIAVLTHHREHFRPSSTGNLIHRVIPSSRQHVWRRERKLTAADVRIPGRELWILHPQGEPASFPLAPEQGQVLLLDGSWREAAAIAQEVRGWGKLISLPMSGESRYWLRSQADPGRFSTVEALLFLLERCGLNGAHETLRRQFELHVYASLRARGQKAAAKDFLASSPVAVHFADLIARLEVRRPRE